MKENIITKILNKFNSLETVEQKSFWMVCPFSAIIGVASLFMIGNYDIIWTLIVVSVLCILVPAFLMVFVAIKKNYHSAFFILVLLMGAVSAPLCLYFTGGYLSGNMLFCSLITGITALCYVPKHRYFAFISSFVMNIASFSFVYLFGSPMPLSEVNEMFGIAQAIGNEELIEALYRASNAIGLDQLFTYSLSSLSLFVVLNWVTTDIKQFKTNQDALTRYFDVEKRKEIVKKAEDGQAALSSKHQKAVILFADVSNFTSITENMDTDKVSQFLNDFFNAAGKHIHSTGGIIDKFIGDCIMAYWPDNDDDCVMKCAESMLNLRKEIVERSEEIHEKYGAELNFAAGIAYGDVIFGDIGAETMHDYTLIGDAVNIASRIQGYATSGEIFVSDLAAYKLKDYLILEKVESNHFFKGKNKPTDIYRLVGDAKAKQASIITVNDNFKYELYVCGCRGSFPVSGLRFSEYGGETSCYVIRKENYACVIDCGTGLKNAVELLGDIDKVDILLTHAHYDHILGLLMSKFDDSVEVNIYARFDKYDKSSMGFGGFMERPFWPVKMSFKNRYTVKIGEEIKLSNDISATFYESDHPDDASVIKINCGDKKVVFLADCEDAKKLDDSIASDSDLLFFDGMFDDRDKAKHRGWGHGTWQDGIRYVKGKNIKKLVITHHDPEAGDHALMVRETDARELIKNVSFAKSGDIFHF